MDASDIKVLLLHYWRYNRGYKYIATECGKFWSDVMVSNEKEIIECEVKISISDLKNDFLKKKHEIYKNPSNYYKQWIPNKFYFAVPDGLQEKTDQLILKSNYTNYGIIVVSNTKSLLDSEKCHVYRKVSKLHNRFNKKLLKQLVNRMSSEIVRTRTLNSILARQIMED